MAKKGTHKEVVRYSVAGAEKAAVHCVRIAGMLLPNREMTPTTYCHMGDYLKKVMPFASK